MKKKIKSTKNKREGELETRNDKGEKIKEKREEYRGLTEEREEIERRERKAVNKMCRYLKVK